MILRLLYRSPGVLKSEGGNYDRDYYSEVQLSSQVLRCCQLLHAEAGRVLYKENVLGITFGSRSDEDDEDHGLTHCEIFDTATQLPEHCFDIPEAQYDPLSWGSVVNEAPQPIAWRSPLAVLDENKYDAAQRFDMIEITVNCTQTYKVFVACRILRDLVKGKDVTVMAPTFDVEALAVLDDNAYAFGCWRCSLICFDNFFGDKTQAVVENIMSSESVFDGLPMMHELQRLLTKDPGVDFHEGGLAHYNADNDVQGLWSAIWLHDPLSFKEHKNSILVRALISEGQYRTEQAELSKLRNDLEYRSIERQRRANKIGAEGFSRRTSVQDEALRTKLEYIAVKKARSYSIIGAMLARDP